MKVHKQKTKTKIIIAIMCLAIIATTIISPLSVKAEGINASRIVDVALTKTGIVANQSILKAVEDKLIVVVRDTLKLYDAWLDENPDKDISADTFDEFVDGGGLSTFTYRAIEPYLNRKFIKTLMSEYRDSLDTAPVNIGEVITGEKSLLGVIISLPSELVNFIRSLFDEQAEELTDFYYLYTYSPQDVNPLWFETSSAYQKFCYELNNTTDILYFNARENTYGGLRTGDNADYATQWKFYMIDNDAYYVHADITKGQYLLKMYDSAWNNTYNVKTSAGNYILYSNMENFTFDSISTDATLSAVASAFNYSTNGALQNCGLWTNDGRPVKVYKTLNALKLATVGQSPYYVTNNANKYETIDNSVSIGGDWLESTNYSYSHDVVQNNINNSETVTNETINNIVNNNVTNITNNYASTTTPDNGDDNGNGGGGLGSILDGLGSIIGGVADIVGFLLGVIGELIGLIGDLFNTVFNGLKAIGEIFAGFTGLLGSLFPFIPQELVTFLTLAVEASVGVAIWRQFKKG